MKHWRHNLPNYRVFLYFQVQMTSVGGPIWPKLDHLKDIILVLDTYELKKGSH